MSLVTDLKWPERASLVKLLATNKNSEEGKWIVASGSSLVMLGSGVSLVWSCIAFHLFGPDRHLEKQSNLQSFRLSIWPVLLYTFGMFAALPIGSLIDNKLGPRIPCILGSCVSFAACMGGTFALEKLWSTFITFGLLNGVGFGILLFPAGTAAMRWDARSCSTLSIIRGTAYLAGFLFFAPLSMAIMSSSPFTVEAPIPTGDYYSVGPKQTAHLTGGEQSALRAMAGLFFFLQIVGSLLVENPFWCAMEKVRASTYQQMKEESSKPLLSTCQTPLKGEDFRLLYLSHLLTPFCLASVSDTALKVQNLFLSPPQPSTWEPVAAGVSLRVRQALTTPRAWILLALGILNACACGLLLTLWRMTVPLDLTLHVELTTAIAGLFGMTMPGFWGAFTASSSSFASLVLNQTVGAVACACAAGGLSGGPGFSATALAMSLSFFVGSTACLPRFVAIAFGPHRLAFLLFGYASVCSCVGLALAGGLVEASLSSAYGIECLFSVAASAVGCSALALLIARCYQRRLGRILDLPAVYHLRFNDADDNSDVSSDYDVQDLEGENPSKTLNLSLAVREYQQQQRARRELGGPVLAPCGGYIEDESIIHFPAGPLQVVDDNCEEPHERREILSGADEAELDLSSDDDERADVA